jgi:CHASE2 domain-containing sensor protein
LLSISRQIVSVLLAVVLCLLHAQTDFGQRLSYSFLDLQFALRGSLPTSQQIVIVGVDRLLSKNLVPGHFPQSTHAALLGRLSKAKGVAFDLLFVHPAEDDFQFFQAKNRLLR